MLLIDVATTSVDVGGSASRLAKIARIAELLGRATSDPTLVAIVVSWLSGELPQRQIGVGWAALRSRAAGRGATEPDRRRRRRHLLRDRRRIGQGLAGAARRTGRRIVRAATEIEQTFLRRLLTGELRQGALAGVMADAVAAAAQIPAAAVRRAAMLGGDLPAVAAAGLTGGAAALDAFTLRVGRPVGPMLAQTADRRNRGAGKARRHSSFRGKAGRRPSADPPGR